MPDDDRLAKIRAIDKSLGLPELKVEAKPAASAPPSAPRPGPSAAAPASPRPSADEQRQKMYDNDWSMRATVGASKALAGIPIGLARMAGYLSPRLAEMTKTARESYPAMDRAISTVEEHVDAPSRSRMESVGYGAGLVGASALAPSVGGRALAARLSPAVFTRTGFVPGIGHRMAMGVGGTVDTAAKGAIGGAIASPDDPGTGALGGAVLGPAAKGLGALASSPVGRYWAGHALPYAAYSLAHHFGLAPPLAHTLAPLLLWHYSPVGRQLRRVGSSLIDHTGRVIASIPPALLGYFGQPAGEMTKAGGEMAGDVAATAKEAMQ